MTKRVLVIGYYHRRNFGDDLFKYILERTITGGVIDFYNFDDIKTLDQKTGYNLIVIGGGDLLNQEYFSTSNLRILQEYNCPIYSIGIGVGFEGLLHLLDCCDYFFMRNKLDYSRVKERYGLEYTGWIPDLGFLLGCEGMVSDRHRKMLTNTSKYVQKIAVCLPYTWVVNNPSYERIVDNIVHTITALARSFEITLLPFDTSENLLNSDIIFIDDLERRTRNTSAGDKLTYIKERDITPERMIELYQTFDLIIGSRFHSIIMAILTEKPFICLHSSTKLEQLKNDFPDVSRLFIPIENDINLNPIKINQNAVTFALQNVVFDYNNTVKMIRKVKKSAIQMISQFKSDVLDDLLDDLPVRVGPPCLLDDTRLQTTLQNTIRAGIERVSNRVKLDDIDQVLKGTPLTRILDRSLDNNSTRQILTEEILWTITGDPYGTYYYGLFEKVFTGDLVAQVDWIIKDYYQNHKQRVDNSTTTIINKNFQEVHRSGWQYVVDDLINEFVNQKTDLIVDTYIDKTFHWNKSFYSFKQIIPYTRPWIGFLHHTFNDSINTFNCGELLQNDLFLKSLECCKCIIVMNPCLEKELRKALVELKQDTIVKSVHHPTDFNVIPFQWSTFMANKQRRIIQVGNWLRDVFSIYRLDLPKSSIVTGKSVLRSGNSDNYFPPKDFFTEMARQYTTNNNTTTNNNNTTNAFDICKATWHNQFVKSMWNSVQRDYNSVTVIERLPNHKYDLLLSENIVFLNLIDASAVNTIIECIVRNTPIVVNRIQPIVELLGQEYPLYYTDGQLFEASTLLLDSTRIFQAHVYLINMDKSFLTIESFRSSISEILKTLV